MSVTILKYACPHCNHWRGKAGGQSPVTGADTCIFRWLYMTEARKAPLVLAAGVLQEGSPVPGERGTPNTFAYRFARKSTCCPVVLHREMQACSICTSIHNYFLLKLCSFHRGIIPFGTVSPEHLLHFLIKWKQPVGNYLLQFLLLLACSSQGLHGQLFGDSISSKDALLEA